MKKNFVIFSSPGTFVAETTTKEIDSWDVDEAKKMANGVEQRYGATPFGFQFITRERKGGELDSSVTERSPMYYLGGEVLTLEEVEARKDPEDRILISNMKCNNWNRVITNTNSWKATMPLSQEDVVLEWCV